MIKVGKYMQHLTMGSNSQKIEGLTLQYKNEQRSCNDYMKGKKSTSLAVPISGTKKNKQLTWGLCIIDSKNHHQNPGVRLDCYLRSFIHVISFNTNINLGIHLIQTLTQVLSKSLRLKLHVVDCCQGVQETHNSKF